MNKLTEYEIKQMVLKERKVKAIEKIANSLDGLTIWFEEIDKDGWSDRIQWYLNLWRESLNKIED